MKWRCREGTIPAARRRRYPQEPIAEPRPECEKRGRPILLRVHAGSRTSMRARMQLTGSYECAAGMRREKAVLRQWVNIVGRKLKTGDLREIGDSRNTGVEIG